MPIMKKPLIETNPYLQIPKKYREAMIINVSSSTAVETGEPVGNVALALVGSDKAEQLRHPQGSAR